MDKIILKFTRAHGPYNAGDKAGFDPVTAAKIEAQGVAQRFKPEAEGVVAEPAGQGTGQDGAQSTPAADGDKAATKTDEASAAKPTADDQKAAKQSALPAQGKK